MSDWNTFRTKMKGKGYTVAQLSKMYQSKSPKRGKKKASPKKAKKGNGNNLSFMSNSCHDLIRLSKNSNSP